MPSFKSTFPFSLSPVCAASIAMMLPVAIIQAAVVDNPIPAPIEKGPLRLELKPVAIGLAAPLLAIPARDDSDRLFVIDQAGQVRIVAKGTLLPEPALDLTARMVKLNRDFDERGLLGIAFDPDFTKAGSAGYQRVFTYSSEPVRDDGKPAELSNPNATGKPDHEGVLASWKIASDNPDRIDAASRKELLRVEEPQFNHNGGMIAFGPDRSLYLSLGDGGGANDVGPGHKPATGNAQDPNCPLGKMLRIDVNGTDSANGQYGIPKDNPYASGGGLKEVYAIGLRNPYRFSFDGSALLAGDIGQNKLEFLHRVERGGNYGWHHKEGTFKFNPVGTIDDDKSGLPAGLKDPVLQYDHDEGTSIIGGYVYHGKARPELTGKYIFGDYHSPKNAFGRIFYGDLKTGDIREFLNGKDDKELGILVKGFGYDKDGEIYVLGSVNTGPSGTTGVVWKIE